METKSIDHMKLVVSQNDPIEPYNFKWFEKDTLAAMAYPGVTGNVKYLKENGIKVLINLDDDPPSYLDEAKSNGIVVYPIVFENFTAPTMELVLIY